MVSGNSDIIMIVRLIIEDVIFISSVNMFDDNVSVAASAQYWEVSEVSDEEGGVGLPGSGQVWCQAVEQLESHQVTSYSGHHHHHFCHLNTSWHRVESLALTAHWLTFCWWETSGDDELRISADSVWSPCPAAATCAPVVTNTFISHTTTSLSPTHNQQTFINIKHKQVKTDQWEVFVRMDTSQITYLRLRAWPENIVKVM